MTPFGVSAGRRSARLDQSVTACEVNGQLIVVNITDESHGVSKLQLGRQGSQLSFERTAARQHQLDIDAPCAGARHCHQGEVHSLLFDETGYLK
jgi:hypothetical protein